VVRLREYYQDPNAPRAHDVLPAAFAAVRNVAGEVLLVRRIDDGYWEFPGGRLEVGESAAEAVIREVAEESGVTIALTGLSGVHSEPKHVLLDPDGTVHQQLARCASTPSPSQRTTPMSHARTGSNQCVSLVHPGAPPEPPRTWSCIPPCGNFCTMPSPPR
jgi:8-oxo-dGTP pyrophosphatase MutT (NUDIX family)